MEAITSLTFVKRRQPDFLHQAKMPMFRAAKGLLPLILGLVLALGLARAAMPEDALRQFAAAALGLPANELSISPGRGAILEVRRKGEAVAYAASTWDVAKSAGYSGRPIDITVLVGSDAVIRGVKLVSQQEPVLTLGIDAGDIERFVRSFEGIDLRQGVKPVESGESPEFIAGATVSSGVIRSGIMRTAREIALAQGLLGEAGGASVDLTGTARENWNSLVEQGAIATLRVSGRQASEALGTASGADDEASFIELAAAVLDPPGIGASLLGEAEYTRLMGTLPGQGHLLLVAASGLYSFKGTAWRTSGSFERIELQQEDRTVSFTIAMHEPLQALEAEGAPEFRELGVFVIPADAGFDAAKPFRLSLMASREDDAGTLHSARFTLAYALPAAYIAKAAEAEASPAIWQQNWRARIPAIATVVAMLLALYLILIFQNQIAQRPRFYNAVRAGYLSLTVIVLGAVLGAQLSVVHVVTFLEALRTGFSWDTFLLEPVIFIIWAWVAVAMLFWGRVYCGWLCPFGALQELINRLARRLKVPQTDIPFALHERLWPIKYISFLGIFAASLASMSWAYTGAEIEPFKTVITLRFARAWPFVAYALFLLAAGVFVERFFCRYLCPLGAAIAVPARLRMFEWLKRRPQCGHECKICATRCPVQAIHPEGQINPNECIYCLNCQTLYFDEHVCPPLKQRLARREAYAAIQAGGSSP